MNELMRPCSHWHTYIGVETFDLICVINSGLTFIEIYRKNNNYLYVYFFTTSRVLVVVSLVFFLFLLSFFALFYSFLLVIFGYHLLFYNRPALSTDAVKFRILAGVA